MAEENKKNQKIDNPQQAKIKAQTEKEKREDALRQMSPAELRKRLSNKNEDYVFHLQKELERQGNMTPEAAENKVDGLLADIVIAQRHGQPANDLYLASPRIKADQILHPHPKSESTNVMDKPFWQRAVDSVLLWLMIFMGFYGLLGVFNTKLNNNYQNGLMTIIVVSAIMGVFLAKYNEWVTPVANGRARIPWPRIIGASIAFVVVAVAIMWILTQPFAHVINPILPGWVYLVLAALLFGARYLFRRYYHIKGSAFAPSPYQNQRRGQNK